MGERCSDRKKLQLKKSGEIAIIPMVTSPLFGFNGNKHATCDLYCF